MYRLVATTTCGCNYLIFNYLIGVAFARRFWGRCVVFARKGCVVFARG